MLTSPIFPFVSVSPPVWSFILPSHPPVDAIQSGFFNRPIGAPNCMEDGSANSSLPWKGEAACNRLVFITDVQDGLLRSCASWPTRSTPLQRYECQIHPLAACHTTCTLSNGQVRDTTFSNSAVAGHYGVELQFIVAARSSGRKLRLLHRLHPWPRGLQHAEKLFRGHFGGTQASTRQCLFLRFFLRSTGHGSGLESVSTTYVMFASSMTLDRSFVWLRLRWSIEHRVHEGPLPLLTKLLTVFVRWWSCSAM